MTAPATPATARRPPTHSWPRRAVQVLPGPLRTTLRSAWWWVQVSLLHRTPTPVRPAGDGPIVGIDARGHDWPDVLAALAGRRERPERLVVVTDRPVMHLARAVDWVVEFLPPSPIDGLATARLAEIDRVYDIERWDPFPDPSAPDEAAR
ncbi:MAG TPA: hypothetical protein VIS05_03795 [Ilumatobacter sp.]